MRAAVTSLIMLLANTAAADGVYFSQAVGASGSEAPAMGRTMRTRASLGARVRWLAVEAWVASDTQFVRDDTMLLFVGGEPRHGSDLASYGFSTRAIMPLHRTDKITVEGYVRTNAGVATATGELEGFGGYTIGAGGGFQLQGRVRALGFAWAPLFFMKRGPYINGALFVDAGAERVMLTHGERSFSTTISQLSLGFAVGTTF